METTDWKAHPARALGIWAHPDDEAYLSAGLMARLTSAGGSVTCIHATLGEAGTALTPDPHNWPPGRLARVRAAELATSLGRLGVRDHWGLGLPDGGCAQTPATQVVPVLVRAIRRLRPSYLVTFGPDGLTEHCDHIAVSHWATAAWDLAGRPGRLLYVATTKSFLRRFADVHRELDLIPAGAAGYDDSELALQVRLSEPELDRKRWALAAHATQTETLAAAMGEHTYRHWFDVEAFRSPTEAEVAASTDRLLGTPR